ncbi:TfoX/Sxy family protein [Salinarimonas rosea]|uniref:TfoX/Sxy family protein n=1 Tax=Salinarimonas rosea TaxID=552063 RepID=UPI00040A6CA8|nr:TfoX/Sxy family protein [Salinarimonas rosea]
MDEAAIQDLFAAAPELSPIRTRRMFGGLGVYAGEAMFALVAYGELYLKVDDETKPAFEEAGARPFVYEAKGARSVMSYWTLPDAAQDDPDEAARWGRLALAAARSAAAAKRPRKPRRHAS